MFGSAPNPVVTASQGAMRTQTKTSGSAAPSPHRPGHTTEHEGGSHVWPGFPQQCVVHHVHDVGETVAGEGVVPLGGHRQLGKAQAHSTPMKAGGAEHRPSPTPSNSLPGSHTSGMVGAHPHVVCSILESMSYYLLPVLHDPAPPKSILIHVVRTYTLHNTYRSTVTPPYLLIFLNE